MTLGKRPISDFMTATPHSVGTEQTLTFARNLMREHHIRHLPVLHGGVLFGVVSDRDLGLIGGLNEIDPNTTPVEEAASQEPYTVSPDTPVADVIRNMASHKYGSALVVQGKDVVGIFTNHDAMQMLADLVG